MRTITGYPNYAVDENGNVFSMQRGSMRKLKQDTCNGGYKRVTLSKGGLTKRFMVHRLVAIEFINNHGNKPFVNHLNGDPADNRVSNLEWCTASENERHSHYTLGKVSGISKSCVDKNGVIYLSISRAAKANGINPSRLYAILNGQIKNNTTGCRLF